MGLLQRRKNISQRSNNTELNFVLTSVDGSKDASACTYSTPADARERRRSRALIAASCSQTVLTLETRSDACNQEQET